MSIIAIYITCPDEDTACKISELLLAKNLIACSNLWPARSLYNWQDNIQDDNEYIAFCKSIDANWNEIQSAVLKHHPYEIPCIWKVEIEANKAYQDWVVGQLGRSE